MRDDVLAVDLGGTFVKYGIVGRDMTIRARGRVASPRESIEEFLSVLEGIYHRAGEVAGVGISLAGKLDPSDGRVVSSGQFPFLVGIPTIRLLAERLGAHVTVDNDASCAAIAELEHGCLRDVRDALVIVLGTGIGGAAIANRQLLRGHGFRAPEFSLVRVHGQEGLEDAWYKWGGAGGLCRMAQEALGADEAPSGFDVFRMADDGDERILSMLDEYARIAAVQIYNFQCLFDVERVAIGGGISAQDRLLTLVREHTHSIFEAERTRGLPPVEPEVVACRFRNDANLIGAAHENRSR